MLEATANMNGMLMTTAVAREERPDKSELQKLYQQGMSNSEIARLYCVAPETVRSWRFRYGLPTRRPRYDRVLPWRIKAEHRNEYARLMLQVLGARLDGHPRPVKRERELDSFLETLRNGPKGDGVTHVVAYAPWRTPGLVLVPGEWIDGQIPIQREEIPPPSESGGRHRRFETLDG